MTQPIVLPLLFLYFEALLSSPRQAHNDIQLVQWDLRPIENALRWTPYPSRKARNYLLTWVWEDVVEKSVGVMTIPGVPLAIIFLYPITILQTDVLRDSRVPGIEFFSIHCCHYDSARQSGHGEARYSKQVMAKRRGRMLILQLASPDCSPSAPHTCQAPSMPHCSPPFLSL